MGIRHKNIEQQLHWLPTKYKISFEIIDITLNTLYHSQPAYLHSCLSSHHPIRSLTSSNADLLTALFVHTAFGANDFTVASPKSGILFTQLSVNVTLLIPFAITSRPYFQQVFPITSSSILDSIFVDHCNLFICLLNTDLSRTVKYRLPVSKRV